MERKLTSCLHRSTSFLKCLLQASTILLLASGPAVVDNKWHPEVDGFRKIHGCYTNVCKFWLQDMGGFYDRAKLFWKGVEDVTLLASCAPPGGGRQDLHPRFLRHFHLISINHPDEASSNLICAVPVSAPTQFPTPSSFQAAILGSRLCWCYHGGGTFYL